jgi:hypothetical protein
MSYRFERRSSRSSLVRSCSADRLRFFRTRRLLVESLEERALLDVGGLPAQSSLEDDPLQAAASQAVEHPLQEMFDAQLEIEGITNSVPGELLIKFQERDAPVTAWSLLTAMNASSSNPDLMGPLPLMYELGRLLSGYEAESIESVFGQTSLPA